MVIVVRDILHPWHDPVRADGLSDDPLGGVLDEGIDAEPFADHRPAGDPDETSGAPDLITSGRSSPP